LDFKQKIIGEIEQSFHIKKDLLSVSINEINRAAEMLVETLRSENRIFLCGNGGSASDSQHIACELVGRLRKKVISAPVFSLAVNVPTLTALSNDFGYENVFSRQLDVYAEKGDLLIAISTSGESKNIIKAAEMGKKKGMRIVVMTGEKESLLSKLANCAIMVPSDDTPRIQEVHILIGHIFAAIIEDEI
jgi:D-sedoheptulose 7-phosphate isomerase